MEENKTTNQTNEEQQAAETKQPNPVQEKSAQAKPAQAAKKKNSDKDTFADYKAEFKKIIWPDRADMVKRTATVIVTSFIVGVIIFCMDTVFSAGYSAIIGLLG